MIKFNKNENNKQFISISIEDGTDVIKVFNYISALYPVIKNNLYKMDNDEILLNLENDVHYDFSLNALRSTVAKIRQTYMYFAFICLNLHSGILDNLYRAKYIA